MLYKRIDPHPSLSKVINCYWIIEDDGQTSPVEQKIIPDGYTEIIFHYGDPYRLKLIDQFGLQTDRLVAGQIDQHFYIENTGKTAMMGIKLRPTALTHLFDLDMKELTNKITDISAIGSLQSLEEILTVASHDEMIQRNNEYFSNLLAKKPILPHVIDEAIELIFKKNGMISIQEISEQLNTGQRQLERYFNKYIGLSPKLYTRIIRFNYIFELMKNKDNNWQDLVFQSGYYDQSHFIKNFKEFTGEDPTKYGFDEKNIANFFLKKLEE